MGVFLGNLLLAQLCEVLPMVCTCQASLRRFICGSKQMAFMMIFTVAGAAIYIRRISYNRAGVMASVMVAPEIVFFTDELKNRDKTLRYWFCGKDRELAAEIEQRLCVFARSGSDGSMCVLWRNDA